MKKRIQLGVVISRVMKKQIEELARKSGLSQGQIAERLMLQAKAERLELECVELRDRISKLEAYSAIKVSEKDSEIERLKETLARRNKRK